jgi:C4-type Zn-finger protein
MATMPKKAMTKAEIQTKALKRLEDKKHRKTCIEARVCPNCGNDLDWIPGQVLFGLAMRTPDSVHCKACDYRSIDI